MLPHTPPAHAMHFCGLQSTHQWPPQHSTLVPPVGGVPRHPPGLPSGTKRSSGPPSFTGSGASIDASLTK
jgi:hypothetical protein